jgi:glycerol transport system ATP-binding protein
MAKISIRDLRHSYVANPTREDDWALKRISLECRDGGAYALLGPSGCGKTTLLSLISGLLRPSEGRIFFDERDVTEATPEKRNIAQVFQFPVIYDTMSIHDNLAFPLRNRGIADSEVESRVREIARLLELDRYRPRSSRGGPNG